MTPDSCSPGLRVFSLSTGHPIGSSQENAATLHKQEEGRKQMENQTTTTLQYLRTCERALLIIRLWYSRGITAKPNNPNIPSKRQDLIGCARKDGVASGLMNKQ